MALYLVSYDIAKKDAFEYGPLWAKLEKIGAVKVLFSEWVIKGGIGQAQSIYNEIAPLTHVADKLMIIEVTQDAWWDKLIVDDNTFEKILTNARV